MLADSLFRPPITPFCSLLPSYPSYSLLPSYPSYSLLPSYHLPTLPSYHLLFSHLTTSLLSHLTTSLFSHLTTSYSLLPSYHLLFSSPILPPPTTNLSPLSYHSPTYSPCFHHSHLFHPFHLTFSSFSSLLQCSFFSNLQIFHS